MAVSRVREIQDNPPFVFFNDLNIYRKKRVDGVNNLFVNIQRYLDDAPFGTPIKEQYIAGQERYIESILDGLPSNVNLGNFRDIEDYSRYNSFNVKAFDLTSSGRLHDTELKFIYNFLNDYWHTCDRFDIVIESKLYTCASCQGYYSYLKELALKDGKILNITVYSNSKVVGVGDIKKI